MKEIYCAYKAAGLACLPTKKDKSPNVRSSWKEGVDSGYEDSFGIGIICGAQSEGVECLDFDNKFGDAEKILASYNSIDEVKPILEKTVIESTISGGYHIVYRCKVVEGNQKLASRPKKEGEIWKPVALIETRGEGGYFVAAPTPGYVERKGSLTEIPMITPEERDILISHARSFNEWNDQKPSQFEDAGRPGDLYNEKSEAIEEMKSILSRAGWKVINKHNWLRPGKDKGVSATLGKVASNVFYVFSSSAHPFEGGHGYTPFQVKTLIEYNGDFGSCAKDLAERFGLSKETNLEEKKSSGSKIEELLERSRIDLNKIIEKPPVCIYIREKDTTRFDDRRLFTLGNFSAITGKGKSKKTFLTSLLLAAASAGELQNKFIADLPGSKFVMLFDTEQGLYDAYNVSKRIERLTDRQNGHFLSFALREYSPLKRCEIIEYGLNKYKPSFVVIDGIADLATAINDEEEASRVVSLLLKWSKVFNCHILTVIHQNKNDDFATGHLGSSIIKKAEAVIKVSKTDEPNRSKVECDLIRGVADFKPFEFFIDDKGLPNVDTKKVFEVPY